MPSSMTPPYLSGTVFNREKVTLQQGNLAGLSAELSTGGETGDFSEVADVKVFLDQQVRLIENGSYQTAVNTQVDRMRFVSSRLAELRNIGSEFQSQISLLNSSTLASPTQFQTWCQDTLGRVTSILNSQFGGEYIFSGTASNVPACVDLTTLPALPSNAIPDSTIYYTGSTTDVSFQADDITVASTPARADAEGICELITGLLICITLPAGEQSARLSASNDLTLEAIDDIINVNSALDTEIVIVQKVAENLLNEAVDLESSIQTLGFLTEAELLQRYFEEKTKITLSQVVATTTLNMVRDLVDRL